jgi:hypothetical protein
VNILFISVVTSTFLAPYLGSWLPSIGGSPSGGVIRDIIIIAYLGCTAGYLSLSTLKKSTRQASYLLIYSMLSAYLIALALTGDQIFAGMLGMRNIILYPIVGYATFVNINMKTLSHKTIKYCIYTWGGIASALGILDVTTGGEILVGLGYNQDYSESELFNLVVEYFGYRRASGGFADALNYGYTMALVSTYVLYNISRKEDSNIVIKGTSYFILVTSSLAVILSLTRGAIIVMILGFIVYCVIFTSRKWKMIFISLFISLIIAFAESDYGTLLYGRFTDIEENSKMSSQTRIEMARESLDVITRNPIGIGLGTQGVGAKFIDKDTRVNTDNYYLWIAIESGILGMILLFTAAVNNFIICINYASDHNIMMFSILMIATYMITGMLSSAPIHPLYSVLYWVIINMEAARGRLRLRCPARLVHCERNYVVKTVNEL